MMRREAPETFVYRVAWVAYSDVALGEDASFERFVQRKAAGLSLQLLGSCSVVGKDDRVPRAEVLYRSYDLRGSPVDEKTLRERLSLGLDAEQVLHMEVKMLEEATEQWLAEKEASVARLSAGNLFGSPQRWWMVEPMEMSVYCVDAAGGRCARWRSCCEAGPLTLLLQASCLEGGAVLPDREVG